MVHQEIFTFLTDRSVVKVAVPTRRQGTLSLDAAVLRLVPPFIDVELHPGQFPSDEVAESTEWVLTCEEGSRILAIRAQARQVLDDRRVRLEIVGSSAMEGSRSFDRVDADVYLKYWPADEEEGAQGKPVRRKVNLSGCGLRLVTDYAYEAGDRLGLELVLPGKSLEVIRCTGEVVRVCELAGGEFETALEIAVIEPDDLGRLLNFCTAEQFRQMHNKVRVLASFLSPSLEGVSS